MNNINDNKIFDIANYIISECDTITNMKLQKLVYYSHANFLIQNNKPLISSDIEAWIYGPVIRVLYQEFSSFSYKSIDKESQKGNKSKLTESEKKSIDEILILYQNISAGDLSDKTHAEDPWQDAYKSTDWSENIITNDSICSYYKNNPIS